MTRLKGSSQAVVSPTAWEVVLYLCPHLLNQLGKSLKKFKEEMVGLCRPDCMKDRALPLLDQFIKLIQDVKKVVVRL